LHLILLNKCRENSILAKVKGIAMIVRVYNKKNKTNENGKNSLPDLRLSVFGEFEENNRSVKIK